MTSNEKDKVLDFGLSEEELELLKNSSKNSVCEGGSEGWTG